MTDQIAGVEHQSCGLDLLELLLNLLPAAGEVISGPAVQAVAVRVALVQQVVDDLEIRFKLEVPSSHGAEVVVGAAG